MNFWLVLQGFGLGASMIIPIGAQNAYVLNQGINAITTSRQQPYVACSMHCLFHWESSAAEHYLPAIRPYSQWLPLAALYS